MSLTANSSLESARRKFFTNTTFLDMYVVFIKKFYLTCWNKPTAVRLISAF